MNELTEIRDGKRIPMQYYKLELSTKQIAILGIGLVEIVKSSDLKHIEGIMKDIKEIINLFDSVRKVPIKEAQK